MTPTDDRGVHTHDYRLTGRCTCGAQDPLFEHPTNLIPDDDIEWLVGLGVTRQAAERAVREIKAKAWDEGMEAAREFAPDVPTNPYRSET